MKYEAILALVNAYKLCNEMGVKFDIIAYDRYGNLYFTNEILLNLINAIPNICFAGEIGADTLVCKAICEVYNIEYKRSPLYKEKYETNI